MTKLTLKSKLCVYTLLYSETGAYLYSIKINQAFSK